MISSKTECSSWLMSCKHLPTLPSYDHLTELNLSNLHLNQIDTFPFEQFPKLQFLDLSHNQLKSIHSDWSKLPQTSIEHLNLSHNQLQTLLFLKNFKSLTTLNITKNSLRNNERFLSLYICPTIEQLIDSDQEQIHHDRVKLKEILTNIQDMWLATYANKCKPIYQNFFDDFCRFIEEQVGFSEFHLSPIGNYLLKKKFTEFASRSKETFRTFLTDNFDLSMNIQEIRQTDFQPIKFLHAHHQSNDDLTKILVHMCAFEPKTLNNTLATCGGQKVCFINCDTCEITHLFEVPTLRSASRSIGCRKMKKENEYFSCLCWINIEHSNENLKILAVGATNGSIYLLSPTWKLMFGHIELPTSPINCLTWHSNDSFTLVIGSNHTIRLINIRSYIDRLRSFIRKQNKPGTQFDCEDSSMFIKKVSTTHIYNLYEGVGPLIFITDILFYLLSNDKSLLLLVGTNAGLFVIKYQDKQGQLPIQLAFPKFIWSISEHIESLRLINNQPSLIAMNILNLNRILFFDLEQSLNDQQLHIILSFPSPPRQIPTKLAIFSKDIDNDTLCECIIGSTHGAFFHHQIYLPKTIKSSSEIPWPQTESSTSPGIFSATFNEQYLCLTTNNNLICVYKRQ